MPQFTPKQLLDAARRAEADGKPNVAHQFYWHLNDLYGHTLEAAEGRTSLTRLGAGGGRQLQVLRSNGGMPLAPAAGGRRGLDPARRPRLSARRAPFPIGRAFAVLLTGLGWLAIAAALLAFAAGLAADLLQIAAPPQLRLTADGLVRMAGALLAGGIGVLCGEAARALFDLAGAARELVAIERAKEGGEAP